MNPQGDGTGALIDDAHTHAGSKFAVHFKSTGNPVFIERALPSGTNHLFARAYFYIDPAARHGAAERKPRDPARHHR